MNRIKEIIGKITKRGWITGGSIALGVLIIGTGVFYLKNQNIWPLSMFQDKEVVEEVDEVKDEFVLQATEDVFTKEHVANGEYRNDVSSATTYVRSTDEVKVAMVMNVSQPKNTKKDTKDISCGQITFVTARVSGLAVLTNTLKAMFAGTIQTDFTPGNIIPTYHPDLILEKVVIENGVAKIYLGGNFGGAQDGWCDSSLAIAQITETAKSFSTVESVEVYQGGKRVY